MFWLIDLGALWLTEFRGVLQEQSLLKLLPQVVDVRRRRILLTVLVVVLAVVVASMAAGALASFPTSLVLPLLMMAVATALFYIWA
ncbi:MAG: hypothetical protein NTX18_08495 [Cyanobium sp. LacPavin_0818_WC50_MAG_67_9]|nr:hypothetical protein [Cyanobium sp. LacPavin_0818_WC50_MAG_67_9]